MILFDDTWCLLVSHLSPIDIRFVPHFVFLRVLLPNSESNMAASLQQHISKIRSPLGGEKVYKDECAFCFDTPVITTTSLRIFQSNIVNKYVVFYPQFTYESWSPPAFFTKMLFHCHCCCKVRLTDLTAVMCLSAQSRLPFTWQLKDLVRSTLGPEFLFQLFSHSTLKLII